MAQVKPSTLVLVRNVLRPNEREVIELSGFHTLHELAFVHCRNVELERIRASINGVDVNLNRPVLPGDTAVIMIAPAAPVFGLVAAWWASTSVVAILANAVIGLAVNAIVSAIFKPKKPSAQNVPDPSPTYSVGVASNQVRLGAPIPVVYGTVLMVPDQAAQPYVRYYQNEQYMYALFCLGRGNVSVSDVIVGGGVSGAELTYKVFHPGAHGKVAGNITTLGATAAADYDDPNRFYESVFTCGTLGEAELKSPDTPIAGVGSTEAPPPANGYSFGPYGVGRKGGKRAIKLEVDLVAPNGLGTWDGSNFQFHEVHVEFLVKFYYAGGTEGFMKFDVAIGGRTNTALRHTFQLQASASATAAIPVYAEVTAKRLTNRMALGVSGGDTVVWTGLRATEDLGSMSAYGDVTLVALRIKANSALNSNAIGAISMKVTRDIGDSPADVMRNIYTADYGGNRPLWELDNAELDEAKTAWQMSGVKFNGVFDQQSTVWEGMQMALQVAAAAPLPIGNMVTLVHDKAKTTRVAVFSDGNITAGSLTVSYDFDKEGDPTGVRVEYRDPDTFTPKYEVAGDTTNSAAITIFGCTQSRIAAQHAKLWLNKRTSRRKAITFETELEGLLVRHGDRIGVAHSMPKWGSSGFVRSFDAAGKVARLSFAPAAGDVAVWTGADGRPHQSAITVSGESVTLADAANPPFDGCAISIGTTATVMTDWVVTAMIPGANKVTIEATAYDPAVYVGALTHQHVDPLQPPDAPIIVGPSYGYAQSGPLKTYWFVTTGAGAGVELQLNGATPPGVTIPYTIPYDAIEYTTPDGLWRYLRGEHVFSDATTGRHYYKIAQVSLAIPIPPPVIPPSPVPYQPGPTAGDWMYERIEYNPTFIAYKAWVRHPAPNPYQGGGYVQVLGFKKDVGTNDDVNADVYQAPQDCTQFDWYGGWRYFRGALMYTDSAGRQYFQVRREPIGYVPQRLEPGPSAAEFYQDMATHIWWEQTDTSVPPITTYWVFFTPGNVGGLALHVSALASLNPGYKFKVGPWTYYRGEWTGTNANGFPTYKVRREYTP